MRPNIWTCFRQNGEKRKKPEQNFFSSTQARDILEISREKRRKPGLSELLRMEHISKRFRQLFYANQDINFSVAKGEVHTLLGENGAGKSTLMNILIGLYQPTEGKIFLNGQEVASNRRARRSSLASAWCISTSCSSRR